MPILSDADVGLGGSQQSGLLSDGDVGIGARPQQPATAGGLPEASIPLPSFMGGGKFTPSLIGMVKGLFETGKSAATLPHDVMTGQVDPLSEEGIGRAAQTAALFGPTSPARMVVRGAIDVPNTPKVLENAVNLYEQARQAANRLPLAPGRTLDNIADNLTSILNNGGFRPSVADTVHKAIKEMRTPATERAPDVADLVSARQVFKNIKDPEQFAAAARARELIDAHIAESSPETMAAIRRADQEYGIGKTAERIQETGQKAEIDTGALRDFRSSLRTQTAQLAKKNPFEGMTPLEQKRVSQVAGGGLNRALTPLSAMDPTKLTGGIIHGISGLGALATGGASLPAQAALAATGYVSRKLMEANMRARLEAAARLVRSRSELAQGGGVLQRTRYGDPYYVRQGRSLPFSGRGVLSQQEPQ